MYHKLILRIIAIIIPLSVSINADAQRTVYINLADIFPIQDYKLVQEDKLEIHAINKQGSIDLGIEGNYKFIINGYIEKLDFKNGKAIIPSKLVEHSILYVKHESLSNSINHLYYTISGFVIEIPFWLLWVLPLVILIVVVLIKRFIYLFLIVLILVFFIAQGLDLSDYFGIILNSIRGLFGI